MQQNVKSYKCKEECMRWHNKVEHWYDRHN